MKPKLALLAATAVGALFTISVVGAIQPLFKDGLLPALAGSPSNEHSARFVLAKNDHGHERQSRMRHRSKHDDDNDDDDDDDDRDDRDDHHDDDDRGVTRSTAPAVQRLPSAPARAVAPAPVRAVPPPTTAAAGATARPANRLLGNGAPPKAQVN